MNIVENILENITLLSESKNALRINLGLDESVPFNEYINSIEYNPKELFKDDKQGAWYDLSDKSTLFQDASRAIPVTKDGDPVALVLDKSKVLELGSELVTNGSFTTDSGWIKSVGVTWSEDNFYRIEDIGGSDNFISQQLVGTVEGRFYEVRIEIGNKTTYAAGFRVRIGIRAGAASYGDYYMQADVINREGKFFILAGGNDFYITPHVSTTDTYIEIKNISVREIKGNHAMQTLSAARPTYDTASSSLVLDRVDDALVISVPTGGWIGTMVLASPEGTASYGVNMPSGDYKLGGQYFPGTKLVGAVFRHGAMTDVEKESAESYFESKGAVRSFAGVTDAFGYWANKLEIISFPLIDVSNVTNFTSTWLGCSSLTSFPLLDTSKGTVFTNAWRYCNSLTSFPLIDVSTGTNFTSTWSNCSSLTSFPAINMSSAITVTSAWAYCRNLSNFSQIITNNVISFRRSWSNCSSLTSFPLIDTSSATTFNESWRNCTLLDNFPLLDTSSAAYFSQAWQDCTSLANFPAGMFDSIKGGDFTSAFTNTALTQVSIDNILTSLVTSGIETGVFDQSGGSAPSATGNAAIDTLRSRGWTVTVTGGY